ncbi:1183_t:CDS:1 [Acaulospora colombiana]|uniref:1183_t:CDS:1 n=1 Tax=Acaulospora colombiana TaxID=27376 RepID=A0ACA9L5S7_9GLOM|nr:1183_t:CDS:1 [Acaulospora colombiana]
MKNNRPPATSYVRRSENISFSFAAGKDTFQSGFLGSENTYLEGILHLNYQKPTPINRIVLNLKGKEKTKLCESQAKANVLYSGSQTFIDKNYFIQNEEKLITKLDIPFNLLLPRNLPESVNICNNNGDEIGGIDYILSAIVDRKGFLKTTQKAKIKCPLKGTLIMHTNDPYQLCGSWGNLLNYSLELPQDNVFAIDTYTTIPMKIKFFRSGVSIEKVEFTLKTIVDFSFDKPRKVSRKIKEMVVSSAAIQHQELMFLRPARGEYAFSVELHVPPNTKPTNCYSNTLIQITHRLCVKCHLWGGTTDFVLEELVTVADARRPTQTSRLQSPPFMSLNNSLYRFDDSDEIFLDENDDFIYVYDQNGEKIHSYGIPSGSGLK